MTSFLQRFVSNIIISIVAIFVVFGLNVEKNWRPAFLQPIPISSDIVILGIDQQALDKFGNWPWERNQMSDIINKILEYQPKKVGVDILFQPQKLESKPKERWETTLSNPKVVLAKQVGMTKNQVGFEYLEKATYGFVDLPVDTNGQIYQTVTQIDSQFSFSSQLADNKTAPQKFLINPTKGLPPIISLADFWDQEKYGNLIKDRYILIGPVSHLLGDMHALAVAGLLPGVIIHGLILNQILIGAFPRVITTSQTAGFFLVVLWSAILAVRPTLYPFLEICAGCILTIAGYRGLDLNLVITLLVVLISSLLVRNISEIQSLYQKASKYLPHLFSPYTKQFLNSAGPGVAESTILFSDLRNFTSLSEKHGLDFQSFLNQIFVLQSEIISAQQGVIDKYIGDAIMAYWIGKDHHYRALQSAATIIASLDEYNREHHSELAIGIGLNAGPVHIGEVGGTVKTDFTVMGDAVNLASRIESLTKTYGASLLMTEYIWQALTPHQRQTFEVLEIDNVKVKGRSKNVRIYQVLAFWKESVRIQLTTEPVQDHGNYTLGLHLYYKGDFTRAIAKLKGLNTIKAKLLLERCYRLLKMKPKYWDGVWEFGHK